MAKIYLSIFLSLILTFLQISTFATIISPSHLNNSIVNPQNKGEQTIHKIIQWNDSFSSFFTNITVSSKGWIIPAYISLSLSSFVTRTSGADDYRQKSYLVMNDSDTNKTATFGSLYNYFDSPTLEWNESDPITRDFQGEPDVIGYYGNEIIGLSETTLVKSDVFMSRYPVEFGLGGGLSFTPNSSYLTSLQESKIIKDRVFYFHQDVPITESNRTFNLTVGSIPENRTNIFWVERSKHNNTWEVEGQYFLANDKLIDECNGMVCFADIGQTRVSPKISSAILSQLTPSKTSFYYACDDEHLDSYPNLTIYLEGVALLISARSYLDLLDRQISPDGGVYCRTVFADLYSPFYPGCCAVLGFHAYKDIFTAFSLDKQAMGFDVSETYLVKMVTNNIELIVGAISIIICLIFTVWGNTFYYRKQVKILEKQEEITTYEPPQSFLNHTQSEISCEM